MGRTKPTKTQIIAYLRDQYFDDDEWEDLIQEVLKYGWLL